MYFIYTGKRTNCKGQIKVPFEADISAGIKGKNELSSLATLNSPYLPKKLVKKSADGKHIIIEYHPHDGEGKLSVLTKYSPADWAKLPSNKRDSIMDDMEPGLRCHLMR